MTHKMPIGADYYPEHWPRDRWETDAKLMQEAGFNVTRLAEFSWAKLEPREGTYDFEWLEDAIAVLGSHGIQVLLCTPTPTVPKWVYDKYPSTINIDAEGHPMHFGNRQNSCFSSPILRLLSRRITIALADHFKDNPHVIGWQLDNELAGPFCYCKTCEDSFRGWLEDKYGTIDALNEAWGTVFWSQTYGGFHQVHLPRHKHSNPSLYLDWRRFHSATVISFAAEQADIIRDICPDHFITHNLMGFHPGINYHDFGEILDFVSEDYYYTYEENSYADRFTQYLWGAERLDFIRGVKHMPFWIMENTAGPCGWETYGRNIRPGELRRMTFQNMAHGAAGQIWFRWRTCRFGTEQYWHGILGHSGLPERRYREAAALTVEMQKVFAETADAAIRADVAILTDYDDRWALHQQPNAVGFSYTMALVPYYAALYQAGVNVDFIRMGDDFSRYKMLVLPYKYLLTESLGQALSGYVKNGGVLLTTCRTGVKDMANVPYAMTLPGYLREAAGIRVEEYEGIDSYDVAYGGEVYQIKELADWIIPEQAETKGRYTDPEVPYAAVTVNNFGEGRLWYVGGVPSDELAAQVVSDALADAKVTTYALPKHVELVTHAKGDVRYYFVLNHTLETQEVALPGVEGTDLLSGKTCSGGVALNAGDVAVIKAPVQ